DLVAQFPLFRKMVQALGVPMFELPGWEADDVIATLTEKAVAADLDVTIVTGDKDLMQLVRSDRVRLLDTMGRSNTFYGPKEVEKKYGVPPSKVVEILALAGDTSDNIPGVPGIGPKTASSLINEFGTVEN